MRLRVHAPALIGLAAACSPSQPAPLPWAIELAAPSPAGVTTVRAWIRSDGCDGATIYSVVLSASSPVGPLPPHLDDGTWGFGAEALDAQCRTVARACEEVVVPAARSVTLTLDPIDPPGAGCVSPMMCVAGACAPSDGGLPDAGAPDAGPIDAGPPDAGRDPDAGVGMDAGTPCTGCVSGEMCLPGTSDTACGRAGNACESCTGGRCTTTGECCTGCIYGGTCRGGTANARCGTGGDPCVNCNDTGLSCTAGTCS